MRRTRKSSTLSPFRENIHFLKFVSLEAHASRDLPIPGSTNSILAVTAPHVTRVTTHTSPGEEKKILKMKNPARFGRMPMPWTLQLSDDDLAFFFAAIVLKAFKRFVSKVLYLILLVGRELLEQK